MQPYFYFYIILISSCFWTNFNLEQNRLSRILERSNTGNLTFYILSGFVTLFIATRLETVGTDTISYVRFFKNPDFLYLGKKTDIMFELFGRIVHYIWDAKGFFIFVSGIFCFFGIFWLIQKVSYNRVLSLTLFCITGTVFNTLFLYLSMVRQATAITFYLIGTYLLFDKYARTNDKKTLTMIVVCYLLASLTHLSCLFSFPLLILIYRFKGMEIKYWCIVIGITYILAALNISFISDILGYIFQNFNDGHYARYARIEFGMIEQRGWLNMHLLPFMGMAVMIMLTKDKKQLDKWYCQLFFAAVALNNFFFDNQMWSRLILYFTIFVCIAIPNVLYNKPLWYRLGCYTLIFSYFTYKTFAELYDMTVHRAGNVVVPYESWLF